MKTSWRQMLLAAVVAAALPAVTTALADHGLHTSTMFAGAKVNGGVVTHEKHDGHHLLTLSDDFVVPDTPAPHWQVVDSRGNVFLLNRLTIKNDGYNRSITLPDYIQDVARVQIWCAWAETLLGEATFERPVK